MECHVERGLASELNSSLMEEALEFRMAILADFFSRLVWLLGNVGMLTKV